VAEIPEILRMLEEIRMRLEEIEAWLDDVDRRLVTVETYLAVLGLPRVPSPSPRSRKKSKGQELAWAVFYRKPPEVEWTTMYFETKELADEVAEHLRARDFEVRVVRVPRKLAGKTKGQVAWKIFYRKPPEIHFRWIYFKTKESAGEFAQRMIARGYEVRVMPVWKPKLPMIPYVPASKKWVEKIREV